MRKILTSIYLLLSNMFLFACNVSADKVPPQMPVDSSAYDAATVIVLVVPTVLLVYLAYCRDD